MEDKNNYQRILIEYPSFITKEQLYKICHISKRTATQLLENGLIPSQNSGKKTRKYKIETKDVVSFLVKLNDSSCVSAAPTQYLPGYNNATPSPEMFEKLQIYYKSLVAQYPDVLSTDEICRITGYSSSTVTKWCCNNYLHHFVIRKKYVIPKISLLDFMLGYHFRGIHVKSEMHKAIIKEFDNDE